MQNSFLSKLQPHTIHIYGLDSIEDYSILKIKARELLNYKRFDLFAKLYYIHNRHNNFEDAKNVYVQHIISFNPDLKEPGRDDKIGIDSFIDTFNDMIDAFKETDFNDNISLIPVDLNGVILDGAHRVATLAYYNKTLTIIRFNSISAKCDFDYAYFINRGLSWSICDKILLESLNWIDNVYCALLWPRIKSPELGIGKIKNCYNCFFYRRIDVNYKALNKIVYEIYKHQEWTNSDRDVDNKTSWVWGKRKALDLVLFQTNDVLDKILLLKDIIREIYGVGKHSIHISDSFKETKEIVSLFFSFEGKSLWQDSILNKENIREKMFRLKNIHLLKMKIIIYKYLSKIKHLFTK